VPGQERRGPINLFQQHDAHQLMRPGGRAESQPQLGALAQIGRQPVSAAAGRTQADSVIPVVRPSDAELATRTVLPAPLKLSALP